MSLLARARSAPASILGAARGTLRAARGSARQAISVTRTSGPFWAASLALDRALGPGVVSLWPERRFAAELLARQIDSLLQAWGMSPEHAAITVEHITYADRHGIDSHGVAMLPYYHRGVLAGTITMTPRIEVVREDASTALIDGGGGLGHVPADTAMKLAIAKCQATGIASVAVRSSSHFGAAGAYAAMAARAGLIGIATSSTADPALVPTRARDALLGTNPIALAAAGARGRPFLLDMATSTAPLGRLTSIWRQGQPIPPGWALDENGEPETDPQLAAAQRRLTPLGSNPVLASHKGYGLATAVEILSAVLPGMRPAAYSPPRPTRIPRAEARVGHFFLALDPGRFIAPDVFAADLDGLLDGLRGATPVDSRHPVLVAGDPEHAAAVERDASGIPLARSVLEDLRALTRASQVPFLLVRRARARKRRRTTSA